MDILCHSKDVKNNSPMFSIIFWESREIFYVFFLVFSGQHRQETSGKKSQKKILGPRNLKLNIPQVIITYSSFGFDTLHLYSCCLSDGFLAPQFTPNGSVKSGHNGHGQKICENHKTHVVTEKNMKQGDYQPVR